MSILDKSKIDLFLQVCYSIWVGFCTQFVMTLALNIVSVNLWVVSFHVCFDAVWLWVHTSVGWLLETKEQSPMVIWEVLTFISIVLNNFKYLVLVFNNGSQLFWKTPITYQKSSNSLLVFLIKVGVPLRFLKITLSSGSLILIFLKYRWFSDSEIFWKPDLTRQWLTKSTTHTTLIIPVWFSKFQRKTQQLRVRYGSV